MLIRNDIDNLNILFSKYTGNEIIDFKIVLLLNSRIEIHLLVEERFDTQLVFEKNPEFLNLKPIITFYQVEYEDKEDKEWFAGDKVDLGLRRRLTNFITPNLKEIKKPCPVLTFYSYKGGTGRTTSLSYYASWLATHFGKKVIVIDCDFEAPGLTNYFDILEERKGVAEYLFDSEYAKLKNETLPIENYLHKVRYEYVGKGSVYIMPAGNLSTNNPNELSDRTYLSDYIECISRIDISSVNKILEQFENLLSNLQNQLDLDYNNSVILIDSRTGFNDTFAVLSTLSDIIVGFFGINRQSQVGLKYFLDFFGNIDNQNNKEIILVNSISESRNYETEFKEIISKYVSANESKFIDEEFGLKDFASNTFRIPRREFLARLGTNLENVDKGILKQNGDSNKEPINLELYEKVQYPDSEFKSFFEGIKDKIDFIIETYNIENTPKTHYQSTENQENITINQKISNSFFESINDKIDKIVIRENVLKELISPDVFPKPYSDTDIEPPKLSEFYFRDSLKDIFNKDKYVIFGYKGTGKTHIYRSFENPEITKTLCKRENQNFEKYIFVNVIPISSEKKYFATEANFKESEKIINDQLGKEYFYKHFWLLYTWSSLFKNKNIRSILQPSFSTFDFKDTNTEKILEVINSREEISLMLNDFEKLDKELQIIQKTIILSYDQLDFVVKPNKWGEGVAPLISYWRTNPFVKIYPKIFVRSDIFENRISNITNFSEIPQEKSISLQWLKPELFAFFFKYVFNVCKNNFFALSYCYQSYNEESKNYLIKINNELDDEGQISLVDEKHLRFLVENFFGKSAFRYGNRRNSFGDTYDWFYKNLTDAKNAISIRPFLDLINTAINLALEPKNLEGERNHSYNSKQVLSAFYYASNEAMNNAAENYYTALIKEQGNEALELFADFLKHRTDSESYKKYSFARYEFSHLFGAIMDKYKGDEKLKGIEKIDDLRHLLISNGIIKIEGQGTKTNVTIPFFYRRYLDVGNPSRKNNNKIR